MNDESWRRMTCLTTQAPLDLQSLERQALTSPEAVLVLADYLEETGALGEVHDLRRVLAGEWDWSLRPKKTRKHVDKMTAAETVEMPAFAQQWIAIGLKSGATSVADKLRFAYAIDEAYRAAKLELPKRIVWTTSPIAMVLAGPIAACLLRSGASVSASIRDSVGDSVAASVGASVGDSVDASVDASIRDSVGASVGASVSTSVRASVSDSVSDSVSASIRDSVDDSVRDSVDDSVRASVGASVDDSVGDSVAASVGASVGDSVDASIRDSVRASVGDSVAASVGASVGASVATSVGASVASVAASVAASVDDSVRASVASVRASVGASVGDSVRASVRASVGASVRASVGASVDLVRQTIAASWHLYLGGQPWVGWGYGYRGPAYVAFMHEVLRLQSPEHIDRAARAYRAICQTCWWLWPHRDYVIVAPRPRILDLDSHGKLTRAEWDDGSAVERQKNGTHKLNVDATKILDEVLSTTRQARTAGCPRDTRRAMAEGRKQRREARRGLV